MEIKNYSFRQGFNWKVDPQDAGKRIEGIAESNGGEVTASDVLKDAKKKDSPLHDCFDWNDKTASDKWRLHQARLLLGSLVVQITVGEPTEVRAFVNMTLPKTEQCYYSISDVMDDEEKLKIIIAEAKKQLTAWSSRYKIYKELLTACTKVEELALTL